MSANECNADRIYCGSCTQVVVCNYNKDIIGSFDCGAINPKSPYCTNKGECSNSAQPECIQKSDLCPTTNKFYPVPQNCSESVFCDSEKFSTVVSSPSSAHIFNSKSQSWSLRQSVDDCFQIDCMSAEHQNKWYAYKPNPRLSIFCGIYGAVTFECDGIYDVFNESKRLCEFSCATEGNFPVKGSSNRYYSCLPTTSGGLQKFEYSCLGTTVFNAKTMLCENNVGA
ncbi:uncharacterized protein LOC128725074 [Anopheles nili]|uniref:uncharacterized protein LOC128725074 n=1 Tax=Anopheles nili TaxID=185578 RepID=UPI00237B425F|nr:uncharacterized protein LOC128725074 [Anopheles nili]